MLRQIGALAAQPGGNATCTIAALLRAGSVGVPYSVAGHGARAVRGLDGDELIAADATMAISHRPHRCHIDEATVTAIEQHEIIAGTVHLGKLQPAGGAIIHCGADCLSGVGNTRSEEHTSELQSLMRISYAVF